MVTTRKSSILVALLIAALPAVSNAATIINFESGYVDNELLSEPGELLDSNGNLSGVFLKSSSGGMSIERTGGADSIPGYINDTAREQDTENTNAATLDNFYLRTTNALSGPNVGTVFSLDFGPKGARAVSGEIWDIDGIDSDRSEGWDIVATLIDGGTKTFSTGNFSNNRLDQIGTRGPSRDGLPTEFSFSGIGRIATLDFTFTGSKTNGIGTAVDNLSVSPVPLPAGGLLLVSGLAAASFMRRRKS